jgi:hypothetical protein
MAALRPQFGRKGRHHSCPRADIAQWRRHVACAPTAVIHYALKPCQNPVRLPFITTCFSMAVASKEALRHCIRRFEIHVTDNMILCREIVTLLFGGAVCRMSTSQFAEFGLTA